MYEKKGDEEPENSQVPCKNVYLGIRKKNTQLQGHFPLGIQDSPQKDSKNTYNNLACTYLKQMAGLHKFFKYPSMQHSQESMIFEN